MDILQTGDVKAFSNFFEQFHKILPNGFEQIEQDSLSFDGQILGNFFENIKEKYEPLVKQGGLINVWQIAGLKRKEVRNCAVLGWLLDCHSNHGQGALFLHSILEPFCKQYDELSLDDLNVYNTYIEKSYTDEESNDRIDFEISNDKIIIFIEAKIQAKLGERQLERYIQKLNVKAGNRKKFLFFLTPFGHVPQDFMMEEYQYIIPVTWRRFAYLMESAVKKRLPDNIYETPQNFLWARLAQQFCDHIKTF